MTKDAANAVRKPVERQNTHFYSAQIRNCILQVLAAFSGFRVRTGVQYDGKERLIDVPVTYGSRDRVVAHIIGARRGEETALPLPFISVSLTGMTREKNLMLNVQHGEKRHVITPQTDDHGRLVMHAPKERKTVEVLMPVPYRLDLDVALWTSNADHTFQLVEMFCNIFAPDVELQLSNSPVDWSYLTKLWMGDSINIHDQQGEDYYRSTIRFNVILWINPPAIVYDNTPILKIDVPIRDLDKSLDMLDMTKIDDVVLKASDEEIEFVNMTKEHSEI